MNNSFSIKEGLRQTWLPLVEADIQDQHVCFIIDTGSTHCVLDEKMADILKGCINYVGETRLHGIEGNFVQTTEGFLTLKIKGKQYQQAFSFMPLGDAFASIKEESGIEIHGLLGNNFLVNNKWTIDYGKCVVVTESGISPNDIHKEEYVQPCYPRIQILNRMTGNELIHKENAEICFIDADDKYIFECGNVRGIVSPALQEAIETITLGDIQYVEVSYNGNAAISTLMLVKGNSLL